MSFREFRAAEERKVSSSDCRLFCLTPECLYATDDDSLYYTHLQGCYPSAFASNGGFSFFSVFRPLFLQCFSSFDFFLLDCVAWVAVTYGSDGYSRSSFFSADSGENVLVLKLERRKDVIPVLVLVLRHVRDAKVWFLAVALGPLSGKIYVTSQHSNVAFPRRWPSSLPPPEKVRIQICFWSRRKMKKKKKTRSFPRAQSLDTDASWNPLERQTSKKIKKT